ncbi:MAG: peptide chain release factor 2 [Candidatus Magnetomorum sp.]|nr:peptide chain release factor 2 [Candidatus Magnetomorum sp.]
MYTKGEILCLAKLKQNYQNYEANWKIYEVVFDLENKKKRLEEIETIISKDGFWDHREQSTEILKERTLLNASIDQWTALIKEIDDNKMLLEMAEEENDADTFDGIQEELTELEKKINAFSITHMLSGENDRNNAIVSINAGAGGTDAQDWVEILFRMYSRWIERNKYQSKLIDFQPGDEAGIKSVTFSANGDYVFGYLKSETGIHRLVRISPFNANGKRHTSFASVFVFPELSQEIIVDIEEKDLRIDVFRASGAGGQHVNKTSSAVRVTHIPTGIVVQCQQEKSQHRNKEIALKVLKARIHQREKQKQEDEMNAIHNAKEDIAWGNQIRSYVLHPYQMVKDHRINLDIGNVNSVLDGVIDPFIEGMLLSGKSTAKKV